jgi:flagellar biosynthesis/type III secretory pathway protein FliH
MNKKRRDELAMQYAKINIEGIHRLLAKAYKFGYDKGYEDAVEEHENLQKMLKKLEKELK